MRFILTLSLTLILFAFGCDQDTDITTPEEIDSHSYQMIKLPPKKGGLSVETIFSVTKTIDGKKGGKIKIDEEYETEDDREVEIYLKLKVKKNSFEGEVDITVTIDDEFAAVSFSPAMVFDKPLELDLEFEGLDSESLNLETGDYDFVYIDDDGFIEVIGYNALHVNENKGKIWVTNAKLNHFSRYGFVNRQL